MIEELPKELVLRVMLTDMIRTVSEDIIFLVGKGTPTPALKEKREYRQKLETRLTQLGGRFTFKPKGEK